MSQNLCYNASKIVLKGGCYDSLRRHFNQTRRLTPDEQLRLIAYLSEQARLARTQESIDVKGLFYAF